MDTVTETQLEKRIEDFRADVGHRFDDMGHRIDDLRSDMDGRFERNEPELIRLRVEMKEGFERMDARFARVDDRFGQMYRLLFGAMAAVVTTLLGILATQL